MLFCMRWMGVCVVLCCVAGILGCRPSGTDTAEVIPPVIRGKASVHTYYDMEGNEHSWLLNVGGIPDHYKMLWFLLQHTKKADGTIQTEWLGSGCKGGILDGYVSPQQPKLLRIRYRYHEHRINPFLPVENPYGASGEKPYMNLCCGELQFNSGSRSERSWILPQRGCHMFSFNGNEIAPEETVALWTLKLHDESIADVERKCPPIPSMIVLYVCITKKYSDDWKEYVTPEFLAEEQKRSVE